MQSREFQEKFSYLIPFALLRNNDMENFEKFIETKSDVNIRDDNGNTLLIYAAKLENVKAVKLLLEANAEANAQNKEGNTALACAAYFHNNDMVKLLLSANADPNLKDLKDNSPLMKATLKSRDKIRYETFKLLLDAKADVNSQNEYGTPFSRVVLEGDTDEIRLLMTAKPNVNLKNSSLLTPLMMYTNGNSYITQMLLDAKADVNSRDKCGHTALMFAAARADDTFVESLLNANADVNIKNDGDNVAYEYAWTPKIRTLLLNANPHNTFYHRFFEINKRPPDPREIKPQGAPGYSLIFRAWQ